MRIGIEATKLQTRDGGYGRYPRMLLTHLLALDQENEYVVFGSQHLAELDGAANCRQVLVRSSAGLLRALRHSLGFAAVLREHRLDLVHLMSAYGIRRSPIPVISTCYDLRYLAAPELREGLAGPLLYRHLVPRLFRSADHLITISAETKCRMVEFYGLPEEGITVVPLGCEVAGTPSALELPGRFFLWVGQATPRKNLEVLFRAYQRFVAKNPGTELSLLIVGSYSTPALETRHRGLLARLDLSDRVRLTGYVSAGDLARIYDHAFALAFPSVYEGFGMPILEAMARGVPVITSSDGGATREVAGGAALLHEKYDSEGLAQRMQELAESEPLRRDLIARGRARAAEFTWERTARETLAVYRAVAAAC